MRKTNTTPTTKELDKKKRVLRMIKDIESENIIDYLFVLVQDAWQCEAINKFAVMQERERREKENAETSTL